MDDGELKLRNEILKAKLKFSQNIRYANVNERKIKETKLCLIFQFHSPRKYYSPVYLHFKFPFNNRENHMCYPHCGPQKL